MTEAIKRDNFLARPQLVPVAEREAMAARIVHVACQLKNTISQLSPNIPIPLGQGYFLTKEGLVWDNWHRIVGGNSLPHFVPVPPTHYQVVVRAFALTQEKLNPEAIIPHIINYLSAHPK